MTNRLIEVKNQVKTICKLSATINELEKHLIDLLIERKVLDKYSAESYFIQRLYAKHREAGMKGKDAKTILMKQFNIGEKKLGYILYGRKDKK